MTGIVLLAKPFSWVGNWLWADGFDPEELRYGAIISVWVRWFWIIGGLIEINYPAGYQDRYYVLNTLYALTPLLINGYVYYRIRSGSAVSARWLLALRPLWPVKPSPRPAAFAAACTLRPTCLEESSNTGVFRSRSCSAGLIACKASAAALPM